MQKNKLKTALTVVLITVALLIAGCGPEASRTRGGGPGADIGNRSPGQSVELHGQTDPMFNVPTIGKASQEGDK